MATPTHHIGRAHHHSLTGGTGVRRDFFGNGKFANPRAMGAKQGATFNTVIIMAQHGNASD